MQRPICEQSGLEIFERKQTAHQSAHDRLRGPGEKLMVQQCKHCSQFHVYTPGATAPEWQREGRWKRKPFRRPPPETFAQPLRRFRPAV